MKKWTKNEWTNLKAKLEIKAKLNNLGRSTCSNMCLKVTQVWPWPYELDCKEDWKNNVNMAVWSIIYISLYTFSSIWAVTTLCL